MSSVPKSSSNGQASNGKPISKRMARNLERLKNLKSNTPPGKAIDVTQSDPDEVLHRDTGYSGFSDTQDSQISIETQKSNETQRNISTCGEPVNTPHAADIVSEDGTAAVEDSEDNPLRKSRATRAKWFGEFRAKSFGDYLIAAYEQRHRIESDRGWKSPLFTFLWLASGHDEMTPILSNANAALAIIERHLRRWSAWMAKGGTKLTGDIWQDYFGVSTADAHAEFADVWSSLRFRPGHSPLQQAFDANQRLRLLVAPKTRESRPCAPENERSESDYEFFIGFAVHLQVINGLRNIVLPCRQVSELLKVSPMTISRYRRWAVDDKYITIARSSKFRPGGAGDATEFRADTSKWDGIQKRVTDLSDERFESLPEGKKP